MCNTTSCRVNCRVNCLHDKIHTTKLFLTWMSCHQHDQNVVQHAYYTIKIHTTGVSNLILSCECLHDKIHTTKFTRFRCRDKFKSCEHVSTRQNIHTYKGCRLELESKMCNVYIVLSSSHDKMSHDRCRVKLFVWTWIPTRSTRFTTTGVV